MTTSNTFVLSWDQLGLDGVINATEYEQRAMMSILKDDETPPKSAASVVNAMLLRARFNSQRHYEIYAIDVTDSISEDDIRSMFEDDPQSAADLIRVRGRCLHSDRQIPGKIKIT